ncbi:MAG: 3-methyl-2-oxobutanoate hydroxymethyltransferase [Clostridiales bacterium]
MSEQKIGIPDLNQKMAAGEKLVMVTAYDYPSAVLADQAGVDMILVGDTLGPAVLGYETVIPVTMEDMIHHLRAVTRGCRRAMVVADMPFGSYHVSEEEALRNALALVQQGGADAVKLEGGVELAPLVRELRRRGIPVMGHIGRMPQTACLWEGNLPKGRDEDSAWQLVEAAQALDEAGAFSVLLEWVTTHVAKLISERVDIPTIGMGAGPDCNGQLLIFHQLLGFTLNETPHYVKKYANLSETVIDAISTFASEVRSGVFPGTEHAFLMEEDEARKLY